MSGYGDNYIPSGAVKNSESESREHQSNLWAKRIVEIPSDIQNRFEYNADGTVKYAGYGAKGLASGTDGWLIHFFTYSSMQVTLRQSAFGNWDGRTGYTYA